MDWPLLQALSDDDRRQVLAAARRRRFAKGEVVFHEGDPGDSLHLIAKGRVAIRVSTPLGDVATLAVYGPGDFFGEQALLSPDDRRTATVLALEPAETLVLHRDQFDEMRRAQPSIERVLTEALAAQVRRLSANLLDALYVDAESRVLRRLLDLCRVYGGDGTVVVPLTQDDLATLAGTSRPTANRVLRAAEDVGFLAISRGRIEVLDVDALTRRAR